VQGDGETDGKYDVVDGNGNVDGKHTNKATQNQNVKTLLDTATLVQQDERLVAHREEHQGMWDDVDAAARRHLEHVRAQDWPEPTGCSLFMCGCLARVFIVCVLALYTSQMCVSCTPSRRNTSVNASYSPIHYSHICSNQL
jgi:hypothetical protein